MEPDNNPSLPELKLGVAARHENGTFKLNLTLDNGKQLELVASPGAAASLAGRIVNALARVAAVDTGVEVHVSGTTDMVKDALPAPVETSLYENKLQRARRYYKSRWLSDSDDTGERIRKWALVALECNLSNEDFLTGLWLAVAMDR